MCTAICLLASASATASQSLLAVVRSCSAQTDDVARLQCYDRGVAQLKEVADSRDTDPRCPKLDSDDTQVSQKSTSAAQPASTGPTKTANATDQFGLTSGQVLRNQSGEGQGKVVKRLSAQIVTLSHKSGGNLILQLDNGQVWEQTEDGPDLHIGPGDAVKIDRGLLGAFWLSGASGRVAVKVQRVQ